MGKTVAATVKLIDQFTAPSKKVSEAAKNMERRISMTGDKVGRVGDIFSGMGEKLNKLSTPLALIGAAGLKSFTGAEDAAAQFAASTGTGAKEMEKYENVMNRIYKNNFGESFEDVANSMSYVKRNMQGIDGKNLQQVTEYALGLKDVFGVEVAESTRSADSIMKHFGGSAENAFNLMTQGAQAGLDFSDELFDNIDEYSVHFKKLGIDAEGMFSIMANGTENGAWSLGKIGEAVKEFSIKSIDGSKTTAEGFKLLGMDADDMAAKLAAGGPAAQKAFDQTIQGLAKMKDPVKQNAAGVALFGTMWEDLGPQVVTSLTTTNKKIDGTKNSIDSLMKIKYNTLSSALQGLWRGIQVDILQPIGKALIPYVEKAMDKVSALAKWWDNLGDSGQKTAVKIGLFVAAAGPLLTIMGKVGGSVAGSIKSFGRLRKSIMEQRGTKGFGGLLKVFKSPVFLAVAAAGFLIYKNWDKIAPIIKKIGDRFKQFGKSIKRTLGPETEDIKLFGKVVSAVFGGVIKTALEVGGGLIVEFVQSVGRRIDALLTFFDGLIKFVKGVFTGNWKMAWQGVVGIFKGIWKGFANIVKTPVNAVIAVFNGALSGVNSMIDRMPKYVKKGIKALFGGLEIPLIPKLAKGTPNWKGGIVQVHEKGGEIIDLPRGTRVYPHDESVRMAREDGTKNVNIHIAKLADRFIVREEADIERIADRVAYKLEKTALNMA